LDEYYINLYNSRRNLNIIGKAALVQINLYEDIKVFCSEEYDDNCFKLNNSNNSNDECITCGEGKFYDVENVNEITQKYLGENYYFDYNKNVYIKCHPRCKKCSNEYNETNMQCDECINSEKYKLREDKMCLEDNYCKYNYFYDYNFDLKCVNITDSCPDEKPFELKENKECIKKCDLSEFDNICNPTNNIYSINETYEILIDNINNLNLQNLLITNKEKYTIFGNNVSFIFSTSELEQNDLFTNYNFSSLILNECEIILKSHYLIPNDIPLIILKIETTNNHSNYMEVFYEIYNPLNLSEKLDLNLCHNNIIEIRVPIQMKQYQLDLIKTVKDLNYNIFDLNDPFYNDICSIFSYNDTVFSLSERKNLLDLSAEIFCMENCNFSNIDIYTLRSICICNINNTNLNEENNENITENVDYINKLKESISFSKSSNIKVIQCFKIIFKPIYLKRNYGFFLMVLTNFLNILLLIIYPFKYIEKQLHSYSSIFLKQIKDVYNTDPKIKIPNEEIKEIKNNFSFEMKENYSNKKDKKINKIYQKKKDIFNLNENKSNKKRLKTNVEESNNKINSKNNLKLSSIEIFNNLNKKDNFDFDDEYIEKMKTKKNSEYYLILLIKNIPMKKRKEYLTEIELHDLPYKYALLIDDRKSGTYYWSLLKKKNKIISIFLNREDFNIVSMKISIFIITFNLSFTVNALFYNDEEIRKINQNDGSYSLENDISRIIYSAIISAFISFLAELFSYTHDDFIKIREYKTYKDAEIYITNLMKKLKIKIIIFLVIGIVLNLFFFYYLTAFCTVYFNVQVHMISDSFISFLLSISYTLLLTLIPPIFRKVSLSKKSKCRHFIYLLSWLIALV